MAKKAATKKTALKRRKAPDAFPSKVPSRVNEKFEQVRLVSTKVALPDLSPDEEGYEVHGYYASVRFSRGAGSDKHTFGVTCCAYARDATGKPYINAAGTAIEGAFSMSCSKHDLLSDSSRVNDVRAAALDGALREMLAHIAENAAFEQLKV